MEETIPSNHIANKPGTSPRIRIVALVPIDKAATASNARVRRPRAAQHNVVLAVEKVGRVGRVQRHGLEPLVPGERRARPLPHAAHARLPGQRVAAGRDGLRVPRLEADVGTVKVNVQRRRGAVAIDRGGGGYQGWCFLHAVIDKMAEELREMLEINRRQK